VESEKKRRRRVNGKMKKEKSVAMCRVGKGLWVIGRAMECESEWKRGWAFGIHGINGMGTG
jgi:hypothetical protein